MNELVIVQQTAITPFTIDVEMVDWIVVNMSQNRIRA